MTATIAVLCLLVGFSIDRVRLRGSRRGRHAAPGRAARRIIDGRHMRAHYQRRHA